MVMQPHEQQPDPELVAEVQELMMTMTIVVAELVHRRDEWTMTEHVERKAVQVTIEGKNEEEVGIGYTMMMEEEEEDVMDHAAAAEVKVFVAVRVDSAVLSSSHAAMHVAEREVESIEEVNLKANRSGTAKTLRI